MTDLHVVDPKVFDEHLDQLQIVKTTFSDELRDGIQLCRDRLRLLRVSLRATEELLDEARRELSNAMEDREDRDIDRIERLLDEVDELARLRDRKERAVEEGGALLRRLQESAETAVQQFNQAVFRANVSMTDNKVRYHQYRAMDMEGAPARRAEMQTGAGAASSDAGTATAASDIRKVSSARAQSRPRLPRGMEWVPLDALDWREVDEDLEFKKATRDDIRTMMRTFVETIVPLLAIDPDLGPDRLYAVDAQHKRMPGHPESLLGTWERLISGDDPIAVDTSCGQGHAFTIKSGRHRILAARDIGLTHVPAFVSGTARSTGQHR